MASTKIDRKHDANRLRKTYPFVRRSPQFIYQSENTIIMEASTVAFSNTSGETYTFQEEYTTAPIVTATALETTDNANVNVWVSAVSTTSAAINTSAAFTGKVSVQVIAIVETS